MAYENIIVKRVEEGIVKITLNRPKVLNALNNASFRELKQALEEIDQDDSVSVVILTGAGRSFCTGRDLKSLDDFYSNYYIERDVFFNLPHNIGPPLIAAVKGFAIAGGFELALACDIVIASDDALFRDVHAKLEITPGGGNTQRLPRLIGEKKAKEILFASEFITAKEAERIGMINKVVPTEKLDEEVMRLAKKIAVQPKHMIRKIKRMINEGMSMAFNAAMLYEQMESQTGREKMGPGEEIAQQARNLIEKAHLELKKRQVE